MPLRRTLGQVGGRMAGEHAVIDAWRNTENAGRGRRQGHGDRRPDGQRRPRDVEQRIAVGYGTEAVLDTDGWNDGATDTCDRRYGHAGRSVEQREHE
ncbi:hypothetical protein ON010_g8664 [Phytophthora cinnamomi]|nr:hypothetical protein ON010_g8664 [Phytophthora cinnamomi]